MEFCDECYSDLKTYETQYGFLCDDCASDMECMEEEDRHNDMDNYCLSCGCYSEILEGGQCPMCFEMDGYIGYSVSLNQGRRAIK